MAHNEFEHGIDERGRQFGWESDTECLTFARRVTFVSSPSASYSMPSLFLHLHQLPNSTGFELTDELR